MRYAMNKLQKIIIGFAVLMVLFGAITKMVDTIRKQRAEIGRLERNVEAMNDAQIGYKTKLGDAAVKRKALEMSHKELKKTNADLYKEVDALNVRVKDALSATRTVTKTVIKEVVRTDTVAGELIAGELIAEYRDAWNTIQARVKRDSTELSYQGRDTITGVITVRKKRFLFFRWGVKAIEHDISNKNPKSKIDIDIAVRLK
jgi:hypothetical protein